MRRQQAKREVEATLRANSHIYSKSAKRLGVTPEEYVEMLIGLAPALEKILFDDEKRDDVK